MDDPLAELAWQAWPIPPSMAPRSVSMIEGCLRWQREGLEKPAAVENATREYLEGEDTLLAWIEECCETGKAHYATASELYTSWKDWTARNNEFTGSAKTFGQKLKEHGFEGKHRGGALYHGLRLIEAQRDYENEP